MSKYINDLIFWWYFRIAFCHFDNRRLLLWQLFRLEKRCKGKYLKLIFSYKPGKNAEISFFRMCSGIPPVFLQVVFPLFKRIKVGVARILYLSVTPLDFSMSMLMNLICLPSSDWSFFRIGDIDLHGAHHNAWKYISVHSSDKAILSKELVFIFTFGLLLG